MSSCRVFGKEAIDLARYGKGNLKPRLWRAKAWNSDSSRLSNSAGSCTEAARKLGAVVCRQQLWILTETERTTGNPAGKGMRGGGIPVRRIGGFVQVF